MQVEILNSAKELFDRVNLDYQNLSVDYADNINFENNFDLTPEDYLNFTKQDLKQRDDRGLINALSNAKRSIDCLIENILKNFDINIKRLPKAALDFCDEVLKDESKQIHPLSLRLFCALGLSPRILVSEVRNLRNKVEHEFNNPKSEDVLRAYEVAELLINNLKAKEIYSCAIDISDIHKHDGLPAGRISGVRFSDTYGELRKNGSFYIYFRDNNDKIFYHYYLRQEDKIFYYFLKAMFIAEFDTEELLICIKQIILEINPNLTLAEINISLRE
ncbi:hypothetical protein E0H88_00170 [Acinetobacter sp. ANC 4216]|uniref:hypothetical protein n=1 Tax=Acinetobacter sp. ANC 4216 TaxID=2529840 RepID=UPI00103FC041|nr:hypothetical protein [Acinetobacter sp. ANC 4216]TCB72666.1 hypothetical protein E0H88_00170 [Acinetobacter sp. ANC 4216]